MRPSVRTTQDWSRMSLCLTTLVLAVLTGVHAAPSPVGRAVQPRATDNTPGSSNGLSVQVWAPLVAITVVIVAMISFSCVKRRRAGTVRALANRGNGSTHELTADQLSGNTGTTGTGTAAARRQRRQRRTPSQISTRSLPVYMEDPGDSEMVLERGLRDMDDPMPTLSEDQPDHNPSNSLGSLGDFNASNTSHTPLLRTESHLSPPAQTEGDMRTSFDTVRMGSEDSQHALLDASRRHSRQPSAEELQARGEAPPYFEVVSEVDIAHGGMEMRELASPSEESPAPGVSEAQAPAPEAPLASATSTANASPPGENTRRRSGFRNFAARLSHLMPSTSSSTSSSSSSATATPIPPMPPIPTSPDQPTTPPSPSHTRHRTSTSGSGSTLTSPSRISHILPHTRSIRSLRSTTSAVNLTSPSTTSLGPISAPLPHTLVRTEFGYPKGGPTTEQMKFISSRETVGRFGVPYGLAAQAQALASREALAMASDEAPPPFESPMVEAGPSAARPQGDSEGEGVEGRSSLDSGSPESQSTESPSVSPTDAATFASAPAPERQEAKRSDTLSSRSSNHGSVTTFQTAAEDFYSDHETVQSEHDGAIARSRSPTPTPASGPLTVDVDVAATKSVPTPPPTPPRAQPLAVSTPDIPSITVVEPPSPT